MVSEILVSHVLGSHGAGVSDLEVIANGTSNTYLRAGQSALMTDCTNSMRPSFARCTAYTGVHWSVRSPQVWLKSNYHVEEPGRHAEDLRTLMIGLTLIFAGTWFPIAHSLHIRIHMDIA